MAKDKLPVSLNDNDFKLSLKIEKEVEWRIDDEALDQVASRLNDHGWHKRRTCYMQKASNERPGKTVFNQWYVCSECKHPMNLADNFCCHCGAEVMS